MIKKFFKKAVGRLGVFAMTAIVATAAVIGAMALTWWAGRDDAAVGQVDPVPGAEEPAANPGGATGPGGTASQEPGTAAGPGGATGPGGGTGASTEPGGTTGPGGGPGTGVGPVDWNRVIGTWPMVFGASINGGSQLFYTVAGTAAEHEEGFDPDRYTLAIGPYGEIIAITRVIKPSAGGTGTGTGADDDDEPEFDFSKDPGITYRPIDDRFARNEIYALTATGPLTDRMLLLKKPSWRGYSAMDEETLKRIQDAKNRNIVDGRILATSSKDAQIGFVLFERLDNNLMFSIVYMDEEKMVFWDREAIYDKTLIWLDGAGDDPGSFAPIFMARFDEGLLLALKWTGPKTEEIVLLTEVDGAFKRSDAAHYKQSR